MYLPLSHYGDTVTLAVLLFAGSATLDTLMTAGFGLGLVVAGAVYLHVQGATVVQAVRVPCAELPFTTLFTYQFSAVLLVPVIVAVNTFVPPRATVAVEGVRPTAMESVTVTLAVLNMPESAALATTITAGLGFGTLMEGAL